MSRIGSTSQRQAGISVPTVPPALSSLQNECAELRDRIAGHLAHKPPKVLAARVCMVRLHELTIRLLKMEVRIDRRRTS